MLGAVSPNFRLIALSASGDVWRLQFVLEHESESDREEIQDIATEFEALHESPISYVIETSVNSGDLKWPAAPTRVVFRRKESALNNPESSTYS